MFPLQKFGTHENVAPAFGWAGRALNQVGWGSAGGVGVWLHCSVEAAGASGTWCHPSAVAPRCLHRAGAAMGMRAHGHVVVLSRFG